MANQRSFSRAAEALFLTQPSVTARIQALERDLGERLFERSGRGVRLTEVGACFLPHAERVLQVLHAGREAIDSLRNLQSGTLILASATTVSTYVLPSLLKTFRSRFPRVEVSVRTGKSEQVLQMLLADEAQVGLVRAVYHQDIETRGLVEDELVLVCNVDHELADSEGITVEQLGDQPFIFFDRTSSYYALAQGLFRQRGVVPRIHMELDSMEATKMMVQEGLGMALLPRMAVERELQTGTLAAIDILGIPNPTRQIALITRRARPLGPVAQSFVDIVQEMYTGNRAAPAAAAEAVTVSAARLRPMPPSDPARLSLTEASSLLARRELSPLELTEACIQRAEKLDSSLHLYFTRTFDTALDEARAAEAAIAAGRYRGPLHGIPFALKDLYETAGVRTTAGSPFREAYVPAEDAYAVARLKDAGAVLLGKLNMHEWALGGTNVNAFYPSPRNPWDTERITGGSSGGSGAALAAAFCLGSLGSDTRGSIRIPAALCGVTGLKPTYGRVSLRGVVPLNWSLDHAGPMARSAADCALILQAIAGYDAADPLSVNQPVPDYSAALTSNLKGLRIGVPREFFFDPAIVAPVISQAVLAARNVFTSLGAEVRDVSLPEIETLTNDNGAFLADAAAYHATRLRERPELFSDNIRSRLQAATAIPAVEYSRGRQRQAQLKRYLEDTFREVDLLLTPTTTVVAFPIPDDVSVVPATLLTRLTGPFNTAGNPAISVPCGFSPDGLPIGLSLAGRWWEEGTVLRAAHAYQQATDWHLRIPPVG